ncbi:hypothetical protein MVEN_00970300 [Mycena venus]|uniref:non-specific serine/threonine protein kinase n=1 Tax=Mycena venus TaxID=2733690 RepID=A0A8H7CZI3_9AGAR|nr:hypothetical protein MVEN_00970300 [Mycena venus]
MSSLARQDTRPSIHSYWSDSNPGLQGPTINLHAAAKPLMRLMYHRQVLAFIRKNRDSPLSTPTLEIYLSYFPQVWNYVSSATKHAILEELISRSASKADACTIVDSPVFNSFVQMLGSTDVGTRISSCRLLASVARHESNISPILELGVCHRLATLLRDDNSQVIECTLDALCQVVHWSFPTDFLLQNDKMSEHVLKLLKSPLPGVREKACTLLGRLSSHRPLWSLMDFDACEQLVSLLGDENSGVAGEATYAITHIGRWSDVVVDSPVFNGFVQMLGSTDVGARISSCRLLTSVAGYRSNISPILELGVCDRLATLLRDDNAQVIECTLDALCQVAHWAYPFPNDWLREDDKILKDVLELLKSPLPGVREKSCTLLGRLFIYRPLWYVMDFDAWEQVASLLGDENSRVAREATYALTQIGRWSDFEQSYIDMNARSFVLVLFESPTLEVRQWTCQLVGRLAANQSNAEAVLRQKPCGQLVSFLRDPAIRADAMVALFAISQRPDGVAALANTNIFEELQGLSQSADVETKVRIHMILDNLAWYKAGKT